MPLTPEERVEALEEEVSALKFLIYHDDDNNCSLRTLNRNQKELRAVISVMKEDITSIKINDRQTQNKILWWLIGSVVLVLIKSVIFENKSEFIKNLFGL